MRHVPGDFLIISHWHIIKGCSRSISVIMSQGIYQGFDGPEGALVQNQISRKDMDCKRGMSPSKRTGCENTNDS